MVEVCKQAEYKQDVLIKPRSAISLEAGEKVTPASRNKSWLPSWRSEMEKTSFSLFTDRFGFTTQHNTVAKFTW